ncbi:MAG: hypothetical protein ACOC38_06100 [Promethearchaeia archaeon]
MLQMEKILVIARALVFLAYFVAGLTLKMGDDFLDDLKKPNYAWFPFIISGVLFGFLMTESEWDLLLFSAIIIGVLMSGKVNKPQFGSGFITIGLVLLIRGIPVITYWGEWLLILGILLAASIVDERGNDWADKSKSVSVSAFFKYRFTLKLSVLVVAVFWPEFWRTTVGLWLFDTGYEAAGVMARKYFQGSD